MNKLAREGVGFYNVTRYEDKGDKVIPAFGKVTRSFLLLVAPGHSSFHWHWVTACADCGARRSCRTCPVSIRYGAGKAMRSLTPSSPEDRLCCTLTWTVSEASGRVWSGWCFGNREVYLKNDTIAGTWIRSARLNPEEIATLQSVPLSKPWR